MKSLLKKAEELAEHLRKFRPKQCNVALMPDFFLDRFISWDATVEDFYQHVLEVASRKGGCIDNIGQVDFRGGNAVNTAAALSSLGVKTFPIVCTNELGFKLLSLHLQPPNVDLSHVKLRENSSVTTALEFTYNTQKRNVMLRDLGSLQTFSSSDLAEKDYALLRKVEYVCVFNWAGTRRHGTELAEKVFNCVKTEGVGKTYYDPADPIPNEEKVPELLQKVILKPDLIDILSLNENEAITFAKSVAPEEFNRLQTRRISKTSLAQECGEILAQKLTARVDLHTTAFSATFTENSKTTVPAFNLEILRSTGAGDCWNAGNIYADANDFESDMRLTFANAVAAYYLSSSTGEHPQLHQLLTFLEGTKRRSHR